MTYIQIGRVFMHCFPIENIQTINKFREKDEILQGELTWR